MGNSGKNTTPEVYDAEGQSAPPTQQEVLMKEGDLLQGLLKAGSGIDDTENYRKIQIKRKGALLFEFRVRPVKEDETMLCMRRSTPTAKHKGAKPETNWAKFRSHLIYTATVDEDRAKVWDNRAAQDALGVLQGVDMIDKVLFAGEKSRVIDVIDEISESGEEFEELAGN